MSSLWCLYNLARHPEVQEKLHQEVISVLGEDGDVTAGSVAKMSYLKTFEQASTFVTDLLHIPSSLPGKLAQLNLTLLVKLKTSST